MKIRIGSMHGKVYDFEGVKEVRITQTRIDFNYDLKFEDENRNEMKIGTRNDHVVIRIEK